MNDTMTRWALVVLLSSSLLGCGDDGGGSVSIEELPSAFASTVCTSTSECFGPVGDSVFQGDCTQTLTRQLEDRQLPEWKASIAEGKLVYDASKVDACLDAIRQQGCGFFADRIPSACDEVINGQIALGQPCDHSEQCVGEAFCAVMDACPGVCAALLAAGASCGSDDECQRGLICDEVCVAPKRAGETCDGDCAPALVCSEGTCKGATDVFVGAVGATCGLEEGVFCQEGLACVVDQVVGLDVMTKCVAKPTASGAACALGYPDACIDGEYCTATLAAPKDGQCAPLPTAGMPCRPFTLPVLTQRCADGLVCANDLCVTMQSLGEECNDNAACHSGFCDNGICAVPMCDFIPEGGE